MVPTASGIRSDFEEFCGMWTESDLKEFEEKTKDFRILHEKGKC